MLRIRAPTPAGAMNRIGRLEVLVEDLLIAVVALLAFGLAGYAHGRRKKQAFVALVQAHPEQVARLYLRPAEAGSFWLHVQLQDGRKSRIAAPWEVDEALGRLASLGLRLGGDDQRALDEYRSGRAAQAAHATPAIPAAGRIDASV